jgi:hypothetical protein
MPRFDWTSHETLTGFIAADLPQSELAVLQGANPTFLWPTQARADVLDLPREI